MASLERIGQVQAHPSVLVSGVLALMAATATLVRWLWPMTRHLTVMAHEGAHATVGSALGHKIVSMEFNLDATGLTRDIGPSRTLGNSVISFVGYLGPSGFGLGAAGLIWAGHIVAVLWIGLVLLIGILLTLRWSFGVVSVTVAALFLFLIAGFAPLGAQVLTAYAIAWFLLVSGIQGIRVRRKGSGDSDGLRKLTRIPHGFWYRVWLVAAVSALVFGTTLLV